jgi:monoamine oxidase
VLAAGRRTKKVIIVGAGLAGLSAAYELSRAGHEVTILEAQSRCGGRVLTLRDAFADGLYADAGATRIPDHHHFTLRYVKLFKLPLEPFQPRGLATVYHVRGKRVLVKSGAKIDWPLDLRADERGISLDQLRAKYQQNSMLKELGDVTSQSWPPAWLRKYDEISTTDFYRSRGASPEAIRLMRLGGAPNDSDPYSMLANLRNRVLGQNQKPKRLPRDCRIESSTVRLWFASSRATTE